MILLAAACASLTPAAQAQNKVALNNITFDYGYVVQDDNGQLYEAPNWPNAYGGPVIYVRNTAAMGVRFNITYAPSTVGYRFRFRGVGPDGITLATSEIGITMEPHDDPLTMTHLALTSNKLPDKVQTYLSFSISWQYQTGSVFDPPNWSGWTAFGTSTNCVYVSLDTPEYSSRYRTVVHTACKNGGASNATMAVASVWQAFNGPANVKNWSGDQLYYYQPGYSFSDHQDSLSGLLADKRGKCGAWQEFLSECLLVHNLWATYAYAVKTEDSDTGFIMNNWMERDPTLTLPYGWRLSFAAPDAEMVPIPWDYDFGGLIIRSGIAGQGSGSTFPASPSERVFDAHKLIKYGTTYYDPSYGRTYINADGMVTDALDGFWNNLQNIGTGSTIDRRRKSSGGLRFF